MFQPFPIDIPPGLYSEKSEVDARGRWSTGSNVRFWKGRPERIGGWTRLIDDDVFDSVPRGAISWLSNSQIPYIAAGSATALEVIYGTTIYDITPAGLADGAVDSGYAPAFGQGGFGLGPFGIGEGSNFILSTSATTQPRIWSLDTFGEDLLAVARDEGTLYRWDTSVGTGTPAATVANAPTGNLGVIVSDQSGHAIVYGAGGDPLKIEWCDTEDLSTWTPTDTNSAGGHRCGDGSMIMGAVTTGLGHLILTDVAAYLLRYVGLPDVFTLDKVGSNCGLIAPMAITKTSNGAMWMSDRAFFQFDGSVRRIPCDVNAAVFDGMNDGQAFKISAGHIKKFEEAMFFYPGANATENSKHVSFNPDGWSMGDLARTSWIEENAVSPYPIGFDAAGKIYVHEYGTQGDGADIDYSLTLGDTEITDGADLVHVRRIIPDFDRISGSHEVSISVRGWPRKAARVQGPYTFTSADDHIPVRARGRSLSMTMSGSSDFRLGLMRAWIRPDGRQD